MRRWAHVRRCLSLGWLPSSCTGLLTSSSSSSTLLCGNGSSLHVSRAFLSNSRIQYKSLSQEASADEPGNTTGSNAATIETHNTSNGAGDANKKDTTRTPVRPKESVGGATHTRSEMSNAASAHLVSPAAMPEGSNTATNVIQPPSAALPVPNERTRRVGRRRLRAAGLAESTQDKPSSVSSTISEANAETSSAPRMTRGTRRRLARRAMGLTSNGDEEAAAVAVESSNNKAHAALGHQTNEAEVHTVSTHNKNYSGEVERRGKVHQEEENDGMPCIQHVAPVRVHEPVYYMDYHDGTEYLRAVNNNKKESEGDTSKRTTTTATAAMRRPSEADLTAERASITKLFLIADSVDFLFTALPCDRDWVKRYLRRVDNAVLPTNALNAGLQASTLGRRRRHGDAITPATTSEERRIINEGNDVTSESQPSATSHTASKDTNVFGEEEGRAVEQQPQGGVEELLQRMVLQRPTSNTIWIHVRDYEQQVPPPQLMLRASATTSANTSQSDSSSNNTSSNSTNSSNEVVSSTEGKASEGSESEARSRRRRRGRKAKAVTSNSASAASQPNEQGSLPLNDATTSTVDALSPLDAVLALQAWRQEAQERARQSVARHQKDYQHHTITRVRFHDPAKRDVTVVLGAGSSSTIHEVLADMDGKAQSILRDRPHLSSRRSDNSFTSGSNNNKEDDEMNFDDEDDDEGEGSVRGPFAGAGRSSDASRVSDDKDDDAHRREIKKLHKSLKEIVVIDTPETPEEEGLFRITHPEHAAMASLPKWDRHSFMKLPFLLTPLLTVFATCVPRRAGDFSQIYSEHDFLASGGGRRGGEKKANSQANYASIEGGATSIRSVKCHDEGENSTKVTHNFPLATMSDAQVAEAVRRCGVPPGPRFFTRITVIVEHAELSPTDLVSLAEGSTPRKAKATQQQEVSSNSETRVTVSPRVRGRPRRIYCLVSNGSL